MLSLMLLSQYNLFLQAQRACDPVVLKTMHPDNRLARAAVYKSSGWRLGFDFLRRSDLPQVAINLPNAHCVVLHYVLSAGTKLH